MASSDKVFAGGRSNFSQTCSLLSMYLKEKGSFGELSLGLTPTSVVEPKGTMDLLPKIEKSGQVPAAGDVRVQMSLIPKVEVVGEDSVSGSSESGQMTIFYGGKVLVFNDMPADKAREVISLAGKSSAVQFPQAGAPSTAESATGTPNVFPSFTLPENSLRSSRPALVSDLPIARKNSLARFLEKRKDRITANAPYQVGKHDAAAPAMNAARLV